jgi:glutamate--cysteine ligase
LRTIHETCGEVNTHLAQVREAGGALGIGMLGLGFSPKWTMAETPRMPKGRYKIMSAYMPKVGSLGLDMMFRSCTVQVNLDFSSEADMVKKLRVSLALQPVATALFANSPFTEGRPNGFLSFRGEIWRDTDKARTGMLPWAFEDGMGFERYVDYALDVPMYFVYRDGRYIDAAGSSFREFLAGRLPQLPGERPSLYDWADHLTTLFPEVRLKKFLEMRGADGGPWRRLCALPALWTGILYDQASLDAAWDLVKDWTAAERQALRDAVPRLGLNTPFRDGTLLGIAEQVLKIAEAGLSARARLNGSDEDETIFLESLQEIVGSKMTPAELLLRKYEQEWQGDIDRIFTAEAY